MQKPNLYVELGFLGLLALFWGSSYLFIAVAVETLPPITAAAIRVLIAAVIMLVILRFKGHRLPRDPKLIGQLFVLSFLGNIGPWVLLAWGQQYVDSALAAVLNSTSPIWVMFISLALFGAASMTGRKILGAVTGFCGVVLIIGIEALNGLGTHIVGQLAVLAGAIMYGCVALYGRRFADLPTSVTAASSVIIASVVLVPFSLIVDQPFALEISTRSAWAILALGIFSTGLASMIYFRLLKSLGPLGVASQAYLRAGVGVALGVLILGETISLSIGAGICIAILGVILINWPSRPHQSS